jgi:hypothetical protein
MITMIIKIKLSIRLLGEINRPLKYISIHRVIPKISENIHNVNAFGKVYCSIVISEGSTISGTITIMHLSKRSLKSFNLHTNKRC